MRNKTGAGKSGVMALVLLCLLSISLCGCARGNDQFIAYCADIKYSPYPNALAKKPPSHSVERAYPYIFTYMEKGAVAEAYDIQAVSALENGVAKYWMPQYLATVIIAVDRDKTDAHIESWSDLPSSGETVGYAHSPGCEEVFIAAISYGLEGEAFTLTKAARLLDKIYSNGKMEVNSFDAPIVICLDFQAAAMIKNGRNMEIIVPREGTYTYKRGFCRARKYHSTAISKPPF